MSPADDAAVRAFLLREARLIDERRFDEWLALFPPDGTYWLPIEPGQADPIETVSLVYDDRMLLEMRVNRLRRPDLHAQVPPSRTCHIVANVEIAPGSDGEVVARSKQLIGEYRLNAQRIHLATVTHRLRAEGDSYVIVEKRVDLLDCDAEHDGIVVLF